MLQVEYNGYVLDVPDSFAELSPEEQKRQLDAVIRQDARPQEAPQEDVNDAIGVLRSVGQGASLGFGDEIEAGIRTLGGLTGDYSKTLKDVRGKIEAFRTQNSKTALISELAGGLLTGGGALVGGARAGLTNIGRMASQSTPLANLGRQALEGAKVGATYGGLYGVGSADPTEETSVIDSLAQRAISGGVSGAVGGVLGGALPLGIAGGKAVIGGTKDLAAQAGLLGKGIQQRADENFVKAKLAENIGQDADDIAKLQAPATQAREKVIADIGENTKDMAYAVQAVGSKEKTKVTEQLEERMLNQSTRIVNTLKDLTGLQTAKTGDEFVEEIVKRQKDKTNLAYKEAYTPDNNITADKFKDFILGDKFLELSQPLQKTKSAFRRNPRDDFNGTTFEKIRDDVKKGIIKEEDLKNIELSTSYLHKIKQGLDDVVGEKTPSVVLGKETKKKSNEYADVVAFKNSFDSIIKNNNSTFKEVQKDFADEEAVKKAFNVGFNAQNTSIARLDKLTKKMLPEEKESFTNGVVSSIEIKSQQVAERFNFANQVSGKQQIEHAIEKAIDNKENKKLFDTFIKSEKNMQDTYTKVIQGSPTTGRKESVDKLKGAVDLSVTDAGLLSIANLARRAGGINEQRAGLLAKKVFEKDPKKQKEILDDISKIQKEVLKQEQKQRQFRIGAGLLTNVVTQAGVARQ